MSDEEGVGSGSSTAAFTAESTVAKTPYPQEVVQPGQRLNEQISPLVGKLIASSNEKEEGLLQVKVQVTIRQDIKTLGWKDGSKRDVKSIYP